MPDNDRIPIDSLTQIPDYNGADVLPIVHEENGVKTTYKGLLSGAATFINKNLHYSTDLHTQNDTIIGAINEIAEGGGGSADIISEASGAIATFNDGGDNIPVKSLVTEITATQAGSGTPAPDNVRAITGVDSVDVEVIGKNHYSVKVGRDLYADNRGASHTTNSDILSITMTSENNSGVYGGIGTAANNIICQTIKKYSGLYVLSLYAKANSDNKDVYFGFQSFASTVETLTTEWKRVELPLTLDNAIHTLNIYNRSSSAITVDVKDVQIELGSTATDYSEYDSDSTTHSITLPETIYKGEADVANGTGTKSFNAVDLGDLSYTYDSINTRMVAVISDLKSTGTRRTSFVCSCFQTIDDGRELVNVPNNSVYSGNVGNTQVYIQTTDYTDPAAFKTAMVGQTLVYPIEDTDIVFAPVKIPTLSGLNNIYSSTGDVEVEYFNENADQTSELIDAKQEFVNYSSDEKVVGKWLDGSTLYEKTLYFNNKKLDKADNTSELVHGIENIGSIRFVAEVYFDFAGGQYGWSPANNGLWNNGVYNFYWVVGETSIYILSASGVYFDANPNRSYLVKIRYTKA